MSGRWVRVVLATAVAMSATALLAPVPATAGAGSAVTVSGRGDFSDLKITVGQTANLINQVVDITWTGGKPTVDVGVYRQYLQIMQCWGDDPSGPAREQCQFGALFTDTRGGTWTGSRQVSYAPPCTTDPCTGLRDKAETILPTAGGQAYVPFASVTGGTVPAGGGGEFFDAGTTNEIPYGRTRPDGTGQEFFEMQTAAEAPGLGCGEPQASGAGRSCWLVIVPRGDAEVDGSTGDARPHQWLDSSPLSATNWAQRIVVPLRFQPIGRTCPIGSAERRTVGAEAMTEAMLRWQPALCAGSSPVYGYSQVTDDLARGRLAGSDPGLVFVDSPDTPNPAKPQVYAPVAISGLAIALNLEWQSGPSATDDDQLREGRRLSDLKLTPRLVAKLLTQSYRSGADIARSTVAGNPMTLSEDAEFRKYNPDFAKQLTVPIGDAIVPLGQTDLATRLWQWVLADPDAKAFLTGTPDPWGMKVNPVYSAQSWPKDNFPKSDLYCIKLRSDAGDERDWCTLDMHPYANNMHDAARAASRGDKLVHNATARDNLGNVIGWKKGNPQAPGKRAVLALTDVATAERYSLPMAHLMTPAGDFVAPTTTSLLAGVATMAPSTTVPGTFGPVRGAAGAYPLTTVLYAGTVPSALTRAAGKDYADLLRYAAGTGQTPGVDPGTLPFGYAPLPAPMRAFTRTAATEIQSRAGVAVPTTSPTPGRTTAAAVPSLGSDPTNPISPPRATAAASTTSSPAPAAVPVPGPRPVAALPPATPAGHGSPVPVAQTDLTPAHPLGNLRYGVIALLTVGLLAALGGPILLSIDRTRRAARRRGTG